MRNERNKLTGCDEAGTGRTISKFEEFRAESRCRLADLLQLMGMDKTSNHKTTDLMAGRSRGEGAALNSQNAQVSFDLTVLRIQSGRFDIHVNALRSQSLKARVRLTLLRSQIGHVDYYLRLFRSQSRPVKVHLAVLRSQDRHAEFHLTVLHDQNVRVDFYPTVLTWVDGSVGMLSRRWTVSQWTGDG